MIKVNNSKKRQLHYFATDGNYGSADDMVVLDTTDWTDADWEFISECHESNRQYVAIGTHVKHNNKKGDSDLELSEGNLPSP